MPGQVLQSMGAACLWCNSYELCSRDLPKEACSQFFAAPSAACDFDQNGIRLVQVQLGCRVNVARDSTGIVRMMGCPKCVLFGKKEYLLPQILRALELPGCLGGAQPIRDLSFLIFLG